MELLLVGLIIVIVVGTLMYAHVSSQNRELTATLREVRQDRDASWDEQSRLTDSYRDLTHRLCVKMEEIHCRSEDLTRLIAEIDALLPEVKKSTDMNNSQR